jgi:hypothetical protein
MRWIMAGALLLLVAGVSLADLDQARAEPNLEKRSKLALDNAVAALKEAREAYKAGDMQKMTAKASEVQESAELAFTSLVKTGKDPRKSPKWFKRAEIESRDLLRSIETLEHDMSFDDRVILEKAKQKVQQVHDDLLTGLMEGGKRK